MGDVAVPMDDVAVARAAARAAADVLLGLRAEGLSGRALALVHDEADPSLPDVVVCHPELADRILAAARPAG